jgi:hypothetical protein
MTPMPTREMPKLIGLERLSNPIVVRNPDRSAELCKTLAIGEDGSLWGIWYEYPPPPADPSWRTPHVPFPRFWRRVDDLPVRPPFESVPE